MIFDKERRERVREYDVNAVAPELARQREGRQDSSMLG